ncbi:MAG: penicillin-binding protein 1C, partial [Alphaproteobacteria bacterium]
MLIVSGALVGLLVAALLVADRLLPPSLARLAPSPTLLDREGRLLALHTDRAGLIRLPTSVAEVAPVYLELLIATEDKRFWWHPGVDPLALTRAAWQWLSRGRVISGGSTLTMQTVRLLEPRPRTLASKAIEVLRALQLEWRFTKREILSAYLTLAPMGGNLEGVRAGAWAWFGKTPAALDLSEAAMLVALPQAPSSLRPDRFGDRLELRRNRILTAATAIASAQHRAEAMAEPVPRTRHPLPDLAPQLAGRLLAAHPRQPIRTTLDAAMQRLAQRTADRLASTLDPAASVAILVVEVAERQVRAHVGGRSQPDRAEGAWVDLAMAVRSPGSALKPFVYGLGFEDRVVGPHTLLADLPTRFGDYAPGNFDHGHVGQLTAAEALRRSLNVPAVAVLEAVGPRRFAAALQPIASLRLPRGATPGLPLVLGGAGLALWDLATLYAALADGGQMQPLALTEPTAPLGRLMSAEAAGAVNRVLLDAPAPAGRARWRAAVGGPRFALKTGTSYGFRDAVAIGYSARWVVAVWIGRPDGEPHPGHYGLASAAPLVWDLFDQLPDGPPPPLDRGFTGGPQRFVSGDPIARALSRPLQPGLSLAFPPEGARLPRQTILVRATGGTRPLTLMVDGSPVATEPLAREF